MKNIMFLIVTMFILISADTGFSQDTLTASRYKTIRKNFPQFNYDLTKIESFDKSIYNSTMGMIDKKVLDKFEKYNRESQENVDYKSYFEVSILKLETEAIVLSGIYKISKEDEKSYIKTKIINILELAFFRREEFRSNELKEIQTKVKEIEAKEKDDPFKEMKDPDFPFNSNKVKEDKDKISDLKKQISKLDEILKTRKDNKDRIINQKLLELINN